jgi:hypothetical protein
MKRRILRWTLVLLVSVWTLGLMTQAGGQPSGDEILQKADENSSFVREGSRISLVQFDLLFSDGTTGSRTFAFFAKRDPDGTDKLLIYFLKPELECGTIFMSIDPADPAEVKRLWLFLSGLGQVKELVSDDDRKASFAGSNLRNDEVGSFNLARDYHGELLGEEGVELDSWLGERQNRTAYKVGIIQKPGADVDFPTGTVWIDKEAFLTLRGEFVNNADQLEQTVRLDEFVEFEGDIVPNRVEVANVLDGSVTTVLILERRVVEPDLPDEIFTPEALKDFNPEDYGVDSPCVP